MKSERINIHELTVEEPEKQSELPFDPERDLTDEDWRGMRDRLERYREDSSLGGITAFIEQAMAMKILNQKYEISVDQVIWQKMKTILKQSKKENNWGDFCSKAFMVKIINPDFDLDIDDDTWQGMSQWLNDRNRKNNEWEWSYFPTQAMEMKVLAPKRELGVDEVAWQKMKDKLEEYRRDNKWWDFDMQAVRMKVINPEKDLNIDEMAWNGMRGQLDICRQNLAFTFSSKAMNMKILAAEIVEVTENGLEIIMHKPKLTPDVPQIPETKQF